MDDMILPIAVDAYALQCDNHRQKNWIYVAVYWEFVLLGRCEWDGQAAYLNINIY